MNTRSRALALAAATLTAAGVGAAVPSTASAAPGLAAYSASLTPTDVTAGSTTAFTATLTNLAPPSSLLPMTRVSVTVPDLLTLTGTATATASGGAWAVTRSGHTLTAVAPALLGPVSAAAALPGQAVTLVFRAVAANGTPGGVQVGAWSATAGGLVDFPAAGGGSVYDSTPDAQGSTSTTCSAGAPCDTGTVVGSDGATRLGVSAPASAAANTLSASVGGGALPCSTAGSGQVGTFDETATDVGKSVRFEIVGSQATPAYNAHPYAWVCFASPHQFTGYYPSNGSFSSPNGFALAPVPQQANGQYVGLLATCVNAPAPCYTNLYLGRGGNFAQDTYHVDVTAPAGDPKISF